jgi:hypothetical protein
MTTTAKGCFCDPLYASVSVTSDYYMYEDRSPVAGDTLIPAPGTKCRNGRYLDIYKDNAKWVNNIYDFVRSVLPSTSTNGIYKILLIATGFLMVRHIARSLVGCQRKLRRISSDT